MSYASESDGLSEEYEDVNKVKQPGIIDRYLQWLDDKPLHARCATFAVVEACGALVGARTSRQSSRHAPTIDWLEVLSFAIHGGLVAGPLSHYLNMFLEENFFHSRSKSVLFDQILAQPPQLFLMFVFIDTAKTALQRIPKAIGHSKSLLFQAIADSWRFWPLSIYLISKAFKKRKYSKAVLNLCSIVWAAHIARLRSRTASSSSTTSSA